MNEMNFTLAKCRSMDLLSLVRQKVEPQFTDGETDRKEARVAKRTKVFSEQIRKTVSEMKVYSAAKVFTNFWMACV